MHHIYMSFVIYTLVIRDRKIKDENILPHLLVLGKVFALKQLEIDSGILYETGFFRPGAKTLIAAAL